MNSYRAGYAVALLALVACSVNVLHPRPTPKEITVTAQPGHAGSSLCSYELTPNSADRLWYDQQQLVTEKQRPEKRKIGRDPRASKDSKTPPQQQSTTAKIKVPEGDVVLVLYDCAEPPRSVWFAKDLSKVTDVKVEAHDFACAQASALLSGVGKADTRTGLQNALDLVHRFDTADAHVLAALALGGLGDHQKAIVRLERAAQLASNDLPYYSLGTDDGPTRADVLTELGRAYRRAGRPQDALRTYRLASAAWTRALKSADLKRAIPDVARRWRVLHELAELGDAVDLQLLAQDTQRILAARDLVGADQLLTHIVARPNPDLELAERLVFETPILASPNGPYWTIHLAASHPKGKRPLSTRLSAALQELKVPDRGPSDYGLQVQSNWYAIVDVDDDGAGGAPSETGAEQRAAQHIVEKLGTKADEEQPSRDRNRWVETLGLLLDGEQEWERVRAAARQDRMLSEALFFRGLLRTHRDDIGGARDDFAAVAKLGVVSLVEYGMARDLLASLPPTQAAGGRP
jgi:hypothetical protein